MDEIFANYGLTKPTPTDQFPNTSRLQQITAEKKQQLLIQRQEKAKQNINDLLSFYDMNGIMAQCLEKANNLETSLVIPFPISPPEKFGDPNLIKILMSGSHDGKHLRQMYDIDSGIVVLKQILGIQTIVFNCDTLEIEISW